MANRKKAKALARKGSLKTSKDGVTGVLVSIAFPDKTPKRKTDFISPQREPVRSRFVNECESFVFCMYETAEERNLMMRRISERLLEFANKYKPKIIPKGASTIKFARK